MSVEKGSFFDYGDVKVGDLNYSTAQITLAIERAAEKVAAAIRVGSDRHLSPSERVALAKELLVGTIEEGKIK